MALSADSPAPLPQVAVLPGDPTAASLYQEIILSHYRAPRHKGTLASATSSVEHRNPLCGDVLTLQVRRDGDTIAEAAFSARACSITQATASMLLDRVIGGTVTDAAVLIGQIDGLIEGGAPDGAESLGDLRALASVARFPARKACVRLATGALAQAIAAA